MHWLTLAVVRLCGVCVRQGDAFKPCAAAVVVVEFEP